VTLDIIIIIITIKNEVHSHDNEHDGDHNHDSDHNRHDHHDDYDDGDDNNDIRSEWYYLVVDGTSDEMKGSSSDDWIY
jgi:hypothetical protein